MNNGDIIVCIQPPGWYASDLTVGKQYILRSHTVKSFTVHSFVVNEVMADNGKYPISIYLDWFESLVDYRSRVIKSILG